MGNQVVIAVGTFILLLTGLLLGYVLSQLVLGFLAFNLLTFFGTLSLILIFGTLYYVLFWQLRREQSRSSLDQGITSQVDEGVSDSYLKNRLIARLSGDTAAAERLIEQAKETYPGMPENWYCERVLDDLERNRE
ncbi:ABC transporter permease [Nostoc sp. FACHB-973]|uniref:ABC transporter permease n=1 Tax=Desmonostoc muscorum LEGE 12446 TaxID=1828758 RepID=A0A8J7D340_DESMC|nr:ABC transporter permease [Desmonostoc muscorum]MBD2519002.1 ABC transporter permease [Nostoc sp. FACHB-973]MBX9253350.1 ABC transporter permease [Desmonostoc muscorum CCALA 125]MCF2146637.1 ABC transporter permease [Desmonostoc muscorum LEGE 12446]